MCNSAHRRFIAVVCAILFIASSATAQRMHVNGLIGENPDTSNWPHPAAPDANPFDRSTATAAQLAYRDVKAQLGKLLFWDEQVSIDNTMSCGTCHIPKAGGTDLRAGGVNGVGFGAFGVIPQAIGGSGLADYGFLAPPSTQIDRSVTGIHTPTMIGAYVFNQLFWDQRAGPAFLDETLAVIPNFTDWAACEDLSVAPAISPIEMGHEKMMWGMGLLQKKLNEAYPLALVNPVTIPVDVQWMVATGYDYELLFDKIYNGDPQFGGIQGVTRERFAMAVAHYMRTLIPDKAPVDAGTMTPNQIHGFKLMHNSGCFKCHSASGNPNFSTGGGILVDPFDNPFSDGRIHDIGFGPRKTPTLRNVGLRQRFFSTGNGNAGNNSLADIIKFYDNQTPGLNLIGSGPGGSLTAVEFNAVMDFLGNALTDPRVASESFPFDRPEMASERPEFNPVEGNEFGVGTPGPSGLVPEIIANAPPLVHKPGIINNIWFKVGVGNTLGNRPALLLVSNTSGVGPVIWLGGAISVGAFVTTNPFGIGTAHGAIPLTTTTIGTPFYVQWRVSEPFGSGFSDAAKLLPFQF